MRKTRPPNSNLTNNTLIDGVDEVIESFCEILMDTFHHRCEILLIWLLLLTFVFCLDFIVLLLKKKYFKQKTSSKTKENAFATELSAIKKKILFRCAIGYTALAFLFFSWALLPLKDAKNQTIVEINTTYFRDSRDYHWIAPNEGGEVYVVIDEKETRMELYPGFSQTEFPEGVFSATVWYGRESKIILDIDLHS